MSDKSNALTYGHDLWQRVYREVAPRLPGESRRRTCTSIALAMQLVKGTFAVPGDRGVQHVRRHPERPRGADSGRVGLAASANLHPGRIGLFEPVHGSAPKYAGRERGQPDRAILSASMLLDTVGRPDEARRVEAAVAACVREGRTTHDLGGSLGTREAGEAIRAVLRARG